MVDIELGDEEIVRRLSGRRVCRGCGAIYNLDKVSLSVGKLENDFENPLPDRPNQYSPHSSGYLQ